MRILNYLYPKKNIKLFYYIKNGFRDLWPRSIYRKKLTKKFDEILKHDLEYLRFRVNYYNKLTDPVKLSSNTPKLLSYQRPKRHSVYYFDFIEYAKYFQQDFRCHLLGGDVTEVPPVPTVTKSRPIHGNNQNSVLLNLNKVRHFTFLKYDIPFTSKKDLLIWRGAVETEGKEHRKKFLKMYFTHPMCDIGNVNSGDQADEWTKDRLSFNKQLQYKFILCIEGFDVASNLKWVMSSNSVAVMPLPKYETWFMEGTLIPDVHFIAIKDDFSDLEERLQYYIKHPDKAMQIIGNAHEYIRQFKNKGREDLISFLVLEKYFVRTGQMDQTSKMEPA
jgi:hypothetical protein